MKTRKVCEICESGKGIWLFRGVLVCNKCKASMLDKKEAWTKYLELPDNRYKSIQAELDKTRQSDSTQEG